ncbi:MAG: DNA translocase FtsK [Chloroflexi bacterium]|nr:DNA translocase FtsK [Chloroflexota bacterium]
MPGISNKNKNKKSNKSFSGKSNGGADNRAGGNNALKPGGKPAGGNSSHGGKKTKRIQWGEITGILCLAAGVLIMFLLIYLDGMGTLGQEISAEVSIFFGANRYPLSLLLILWGLIFLYPTVFPRRVLDIGYTFFLFISLQMLLFLFTPERGGIFGRWLTGAPGQMLGHLGLSLIIITVNLIIIAVLFPGSVRKILALIPEIMESVAGFFNKLFKKPAKKSPKKDEKEKPGAEKPEPEYPPLITGHDRQKVEEPEVPVVVAAPAVEPFKEAVLEPVIKEEQVPPGGEKKAEQIKEEKKPAVPVVSMKPKEPISLAKDVKFAKRFKTPPHNLLQREEPPRKKEIESIDYSEILVETLKSFGVETRMVNVERGPSVTRYELQPARGVKVSRITNLTNDIALALAALSIRIEAPVPGKSVIGIEVPNQRIDPVMLRSIVSSKEFDKGGKFSIALGKDITGHMIMDDLIKMPHLLIAGATGSGKTVCLNCVIASLLFRATPLDLQMVMIDPKRVEMSIYEGLPHLVDTGTSANKRIVTDPRQATLVLKKVTQIMDSRYEEFVTKRARNIVEYNAIPEIEPLPYIVVIIDELADLMMISSSTVEMHICRLAQLGRAAGIHLIVATQRPSVDVITGLIKANIPSRIAFAVTSQVDSRVILDRVGAEKLLGRGDMLYLPIDASEPKRIQGAFMDGDEIETLVDYWKGQGELEPDKMVNLPELNGGENYAADVDDGEDEGLMLQAVQVILSGGQASASSLQRKLKIGYARAGRIMDLLEERGAVGPVDGSRPRQLNRDILEAILEKSVSNE